MIRFLITFLLLVPSFGHAAGKTRTLLDCNTSAGPDQQVTVGETDGAYTLFELLASGMMVERSLSSEEWESGVLQLRDGTLGEKSTLKKVQDGWFFESVGPGIRNSGYADCWVSEAQAG